MTPIGIILVSDIECCKLNTDNGNCTEMKNKLFKTPNAVVQQSIIKAAMASAKIEGMLISEKDAQKSLQKVMSQLTKGRGKV